MPFNPPISTQLAQKLKALHKPGDPLILTNIWDAPSLSIALANPRTKAIATASFAVAAVAGLEDEELTLEDNLYAISRISARLVKEGKADSIPLTVDLQDGYGDRLREAVEKIVELGAVGCNLEDERLVNGKPKLYGAEEQAERVKAVIEIAQAKGVGGFVVNARSDAVLLGGTIAEAIARGKLYLEAGATTIFVWGGMKRGLRDTEVTQLVSAFNGQLNVIYRKTLPQALSLDELAQLGVARVSMGPALWREAMMAMSRELGKILEGYSGAGAE